MPNAWIEQMFDAQIVDREGIVRRKKRDVHRNASFESLLEYVREQDFHLIETGDQYIVVCNPGVLKIHC
jgi:hypothetical protein